MADTTDSSEETRPRGGDPSTVVANLDERSLADSGSESRFAPGWILGGRYRIVSMLGRGGMGEVYRADDLTLGQAVALKFLPASLRSNTAARERLYREARAGRAVTHQNVCRLYDAVEVDDHLFLSMEYVDGEDLASLLRRIGRFAPDKALAVIRDVCAGLAAAHEKEVVHADLKPANIMIDGRGRARITDFGLAALAAGRSRRGVVAGTPRYMAPEQFVGAPPSVRSDIYALGLVMAEIFTGRPVNEASSIGEIVERQKTADQISIVDLVPGLDPRIDGVIRECLRNDPAARPSSVAEILERLPARDPLAAAVAAGETPSPRMIIDAGESGELSRRAAWLALAAALAGTLVIALVASRTMVYARQPVQPPEALESRAREILARFAPGSVIRDTASWISIDGEAGEFVVSGIGAGTKRLGDGNLLYHFRSGAEPLAATNTEFRVIDNDPPFDRAGMTRVVLDQGGKLVELAVVPPRHEGTAVTARSVHWLPLLRETGADIVRLTASRPEWSAPFDTDAKSAWRTVDARTGIPLRIEAASRRGRPVWLAVIGATRPEQVVRDTPMQLNRVAITVNIFLLIAVPIAIILLALRNIRRGHGDLRGATKLGLFVGGASFVTAVLRADHSTSLQQEWLAASLMVTHAAFWGAAVWGGYVAAEPLVRKRWPRMMIGWSRLLAGRWRDPMIGREVLAGICGAVVVLLAWHATVLVPDWLGQRAAPLSLAVTPLGSARHVAYFLVRALGEAILRAVGAAVLLLVFRILTRSRVIGAALAIVVITLSFLGDSTAAAVPRGLSAFLASVVVLLLLTRFGVLSVAVAAYCIIVMRTLPITLDVTQWYFARGSLAIAAVVLLSLFGFLVSLGKKSILPAGIFEEG